MYRFAWNQCYSSYVASGLDLSDWIRYKVQGIRVRAHQGCHTLEHCKNKDNDKKRLSEKAALPGIPNPNTKSKSKKAKGKKQKI